MLIPAFLTTRSTLTILMITGLLLVIFISTGTGLAQQSLWNDEAWTSWAIRSPYLSDILERVRADVHPPLYFLILGIISRFSGDSVLALRWLSALFGTLALASTFAVGQQLFDRYTATLATIILGSTGFFVYYTREARMYTLLLAISCFANLLYLRWRKQPTRWHTLFYSLSMASIFYTHYAGALLILSHLLHAILIQLKRQPNKSIQWRTLAIPYLLALLLFSPWLPTFINQIHNNPNGPLAIPVPTSWATIAGLILILTGGSWGLIITPYVLGYAVPKIRHYSEQILFLVMCFLVTPLSLLALNKWVTPVYQIRYTITMLPAGALLVAYGLRHVGLPQRLINRLSVVSKFTRGLAVVILIWIVHVQISTYHDLWPSKPSWEKIIRSTVEARKSLDIVLTDMAAYSPVAYYDRQLGLRRGINIDLSWRLHTPTETIALVKNIQSEQTIWIALPVNTAKSWQIAAQLNQKRGVGYRSGLENMIFYSFDFVNDTRLLFQFGDLLRITDELQANTILSTTAGQTLCTTINMETLQNIDNSFSLGLHLVDITGNISAAQWDEGFGAHLAHNKIELHPCLAIPADLAIGSYHLELTLYNWATIERVPVIETSRNHAVRWGDVFMMQAVEIR